MGTLRKNKILITLFALFMGLCAMLGIFATAPRSASADTSDTTTLEFIEDEELTTKLLCGGLYRIRKTNGALFVGNEKDITLSADPFSYLRVDIESGFLIHECGNSECGQKSRISKIVNKSHDLEYIDISIPGQYRCVCGVNSSIKDMHFFTYTNSNYEAHHLIPDVDLSSVTSFFTSKDVLLGGSWVKMDLDEFYQEADGSYYIDCHVTYSVSGYPVEYDTVLRIRVSDVFCVFIDTYAYVINYSLVEMDPITKYVVGDDFVAFYIPKSYVIFEINEKVVEGPTDGPNDNDGNETLGGSNDNNENGTQNGGNNGGVVEDEKSNIFSDLSSLLKTILLISSFVTIAVVLYSLFRRQKKHRSKK